MPLPRPNGPTRVAAHPCRDSHIPTAPVTVFPVLKTKRKETLATDLQQVRSGSFFDEKMLLPLDSAGRLVRQIVVNAGYIGDAHKPCRHFPQQIIGHGNGIRGHPVN